MTIDLFAQKAIGLLDAADIEVGPWGTVPSGAGWQAAPGQSAYVPYVQVTRLGSADQLSATLDDRFDDFRVDLFCRYFAGTQLQAEETSAAVRGVLLGFPQAPDGFKTVRCRVYNSQTTTRSQHTEVSIFEAGDFFRWWCAPTGAS